MIASDAPARGGTRPRVAVLEARMNAELVGLLARHGAEAWSVPAVVEAPVESGAAVRALIDALTAGTLRAVIVLTGAGVRALVAEAEAIGREDELLAGLRAVTIVCRGPKPVAVLKRLAVPIARVAREPHTTAELLDALSDLPVDGMAVAIVHHGERNEVLAASLEARGALLTELLLYEWLMPENTAPLAALVDEIVDGRLDAIAFTSQIQARHLFRVAESFGRSAELADALNSRTVVASIGPTCTATLRELGVAPGVVPFHPKMGHLVVALAAHLGIIVP